MKCMITPIPKMAFNGSVGKVREVPQHDYCVHVLEPLWEAINTRVRFWRQKTALRVG
ncbi:hypothetical protein [Azospirillum endophyticum]